MAQAQLRISTSTHVAPGTAQLRVIARELRAMDDAKVKALFRRNLEAAARPFVPRVAASALAIPAAGRKHTGLRGRIAACARTASWEPGPRQVSVAVEIDPRRMPDHEKGLPLYMEGVADKARHNRWRHPVYGRSKDSWVTQDAHPYFYPAARPFGRAAGDALGKALDEITRDLSG